MEEKIWLSSPHMGGSEKKYIEQAFDGNWITSLGPNICGFEEDIQDFLGEGVHVAAVSSGTSALHLALILLGVQAGDEVLCQSLTFVASANPIIYLGAKPIFIDSEEETWNICPIALEEAIIDQIKHGKKPKAIIAVSLYGMPYKVNEIQAIASKYDIPLIDDSAEALGSSYKGRKCGTFGDLSVVSFNGNKIITTSGGGALIVKDKTKRDRAVFLSTQSKDDAPHYQHSQLGYNYRLSNVSAGIGRGQMEVLEDRIMQRRENHNFYVEVFKDIPGVSLLTEPNEDYFSNYWLTAILVDPKITNCNRETIRLALLNEGVESRPLWKPLHLQPIFENCKFYGKSIAENLFEHGLCLPSGSNMTMMQKNRIKAILQNVLGV